MLVQAEVESMVGLRTGVPEVIQGPECKAPHKVGLVEKQKVP